MKNTSRILVLILLMVLIVGIRVIAPLSPDFKVLANFSGIGAIALFGGAYFKNKINAFLLPVIVLFLSDLGLVLTMGKNYGFYEGWYYTYIAFILMVLVGKLMINKVTVANVLGASIVGVLIHWIVADYAYFIVQTDYPQTFVGFWSVLKDAIPYERNFLYGTLAYSALMFGAFETLKVKFPVLNLTKETAVN